jgi:hypothetical protein
MSTMIFLYVMHLELHINSCCYLLAWQAFCFLILDDTNFHDMLDMKGRRFLLSLRLLLWYDRLANLSNHYQMITPSSDPEFLTRLTNIAVQFEDKTFRISATKVLILIKFQKSLYQSVVCKIWFLISYWTVIFDVCCQLSTMICWLLSYIYLISFSVNYRRKKNIWKSFTSSSFISTLFRFPSASSIFLLVNCFQDNISTIHIPASWNFYSFLANKFLISLEFITSLMKLFKKLKIL